jgi:hypothetical protein
LTVVGNRTLARAADVVLALAFGLFIVGLVGGFVSRAVGGVAVASAGMGALAAAAAGTGVSFLLRSSVVPPGGERKRYAGVGGIGFVMAALLSMRIVWHAGLSGTGLWLSLFVLGAGIGVLVYWEDLRARS